MGHSNPAMTRHYTHVGEVAAGAAVAALPAIGEAFSGSKLEEPLVKRSVIEALAEVGRIVEGLTAENWESTRARVLAAVKAAMDRRAR